MNQTFFYNKDNVSHYVPSSISISNNFLHTLRKYNVHTTNLLINYYYNKYNTLSYININNTFIHDTPKRWILT